MELTKTELELQLQENNMSPFLVIGLIVANIILKNKNCIVGFNLLNKLQIDETIIDLSIPTELKNKDITEVAKILLDLNFSDEEIIEKLKYLESVNT